MEGDENECRRRKGGVVSTARRGGRTRSSVKLKLRQHLYNRRFCSSFSLSVVLLLYTVISDLPTILPFPSGSAQNLCSNSRPFLSLCQWVFFISSFLFCNLVFMLAFADIVCNAQLNLDVQETGEKTRASERDPTVWLITRYIYDFFYDTIFRLFPLPSLEK